MQELTFINKHLLGARHYTEQYAHRGKQTWTLSSYKYVKKERQWPSDYKCLEHSRRKVQGAKQIHMEGI